MMKCSNGHLVKLPVIVGIITKPIICWKCLIERN